MDYRDTILQDMKNLKLRVENLEKTVLNNQYNQLEFFMIDDRLAKTFEKVCKFKVLKSGQVKFRLTASIGNSSGSFYGEIFLNGIKVKRFYNESVAVDYEFESALSSGVCEMVVRFMHPLAYTVSDFKISVSGNVEYEDLPLRIDGLNLENMSIVAYLMGSSAYVYGYDTSLKVICRLDALSVGVAVRNGKLCVGYVNGQRQFKLMVYNLEDFSVVSQDFIMEGVRKVASCVYDDGFAFYCLKNNRCYKVLIADDFSSSVIQLFSSVKDIVSTTDAADFYAVTDFSGYTKIYCGSDVYRVEKAKNYHLYSNDGEKYAGFYKNGTYYLKKLEKNTAAKAETAVLGDEFIRLYDGKKLIRNNNKLTINEE
ncbi:MAG: hypothetical protein ACI4M6_01195 [Christensenellaceae bacterium]